MSTPLRVLLIEDVEDDALLILHALRKADYDPDHLRVETAESMREALRTKNWDIILCDYRLPNFSGPDAINLVKETDLDIPLIMVSGTIGEETAVECMRLGARDYIHKDNLFRLAPAVKRELSEAWIRQALTEVEEQWRKSWERYRLITETIHDLIITTNLDWKITYVNKAVRDLLGDIDPVGISITDFTPPELSHKQRAMMKRRLEGYDGILSYEWKAVDTAGRVVILDVLSQTVKENQKPVGMMFIARDITSRKKADEALAESENKYRLVVENAREAIMIMQDAKLVFANQMTQDLTGYTGSAVESLPVTRFIHPDDVNLVIKNHLRRLKGEIVPSVYSFRVITRQGETIWVELKATLITWKERPATLNFMVDITERRAAQEAMRQLLERFDLATHAASLGVWDRDIQTNQLVWNDRMYELYGVKKGDFSNTQEAWLNLLHPDDVAPTLSAIQMAMDSGINSSDNNKYFSEFRIIQPDGTLKHIRAYGKVTLDAGGTPLRVTGINYDITSFKQADERLRESEFKYRSLFTEISEGFALHEMIFDSDGKPVDYSFLDINPAFEKITGLAAADVIGKRVRQVLPQTEASWIEIYGKVATTGQPVSFENYASAFDRYYQVNAFCPQKGQFAVLFTDITERKKMEAQLIQAQKMEAIGTLAGGIAHDFNNILGAIIGYAGMAQDELPPDSPTIECIDEIFRASERAKKLVEQILAFSRRQDAERKPLMIIPLLKEIVKLLRPMLPTTIRIKEDFQVQDTSILADATQMHQVLMNLCTNSAHAMREKGGILTVGLRKIEIIEDRGTRYDDSLKAGTYLELKVADTGHGIDEKIRNQIFDPFFTTKKPGEGTGMGLSVVHGIIKSYGGHIRLESQVGEGTTFFIYLPIHQKQNQSTIVKVKSATAGGTEKILLVDDQEMMLNMMSMALSRAGYQVTARKNSPEALELFRANPFAFDLVITDQTMPYLTGADMAKQMLQIRPSLPVILCTGYSSTVSADEASSAGIRAYVMKPVVVSEFTHLIRKVLTQDGRTN